MKTNKLIGLPLDWAAAKCEGAVGGAEQIFGGWKPSTNWFQGGPIIERERIALSPSRAVWVARIAQQGDELAEWLQRSGPTPLIAAMRCYVASKLGDEVDVPNF